MAVTMTKVGVLPKVLKYEGTCDYCKSEYLAEEDDLKYHSDYHDAYHTAECVLTGCSSIVYFTKQRL